MTTGKSMTTISEVINDLREKGYIEDFELSEDGFVHKGNNNKYQPENLTINKSYRFEGNSNPDDMSVLFALESDDGTKGIFVDAYGAYAAYDGKVYADLLRRLKKR